MRSMPAITGNSYCRAYFDSKSWYDGYVEADEFDTRVMNQYEAANINLMVEYMEKIS